MNYVFKDKCFRIKSLILSTSYINELTLLKNEYKENYTYYNDLSYISII